MMKTSVIFLASMLIAVTAFTQNEETKWNNTEAKFPKKANVIQGNKIESINDYLVKNVEYPQQSINCSYQGTELIQFTVTIKGEIGNIKVLNSVCPKIDEEVIRVLQTTTGKWKPAQANGKNIETQKEISLPFLLNPYTNFVAMAKNYLNKGNKWMFVKNNPHKALKYYNRGIKLLPNEETLLAVRGLCKYKLDDTNGAQTDWERLKILAERDNTKINFNYLAEDYKNTEGFAEMVEILENDFPQ